MNMRNYGSAVTGLALLLAFCVAGDAQTTRIRHHSVGAQCIPGRRLTQAAAICRAKPCEVGTTVLAASGIGNRGTRLPGGRYMVRLATRPDDRQQSRAIISVQVGR